MKKIFILLAFFLLLLSDGIYAQAPRTPLIEEFTQASCPNCPRANVYLNPLLATYPLGQVVAIKYQVNYPGVDTLNLQNPADAGATSQGVPFGRALPYDILGVPAAAVDGDTSILETPSANDYTGDPNLLTTAMISAEMALTTPITLTATFNYDAATDSFTSRLVVTNVSPTTLYSTSTGKLKLFLSLEEMNIHFSPDDHPGDNGEGDFYYIDRKMYPSYNGTTMPDSIVSGDSVVYTFTEKVPSYIYNKLELGVAAFVQDMGLPRTSQSVLQAVFATSSNVTDAIMTDNTTYPSSTAVCNETFTPSLTLTNNGTTTLTSATVGYYFNSNTAVTQPWTGSLTAGQSTTVTLAPVTVADNTFSSINYFINNYNSGAIIDVNDANNTPSSSNTIVSIPAVATLDSLVETFDEGSDQYVGYLFTGQSLATANSFGFVADQSFLTNYIWQSVTSSDPIGGYGLSDASYYFELAGAASGSTVGLVFDKVNLTGYNTSKMTFDHAYAPINGSKDVLNVLVSTDCGTTWSTAWTESGSALATSPDENSVAFTPTTTQWVTDTVDLSAYNNTNNVIVQFQAIDKGGNGLFIDNINWLVAAPLGVKNITNVLSSSVYPNPANDNITLSINLSNTDNFEINIIDDLGQNVKNVSNGELSQGSHSMDVNIADLTSGIYSFVIKSNGQTMVKRFVVAQQ